MTISVEDSSTKADEGSSSLPVMVAIVAVIGELVFLVNKAAQPVWDPDLWWHLRAGQGYLDGWSLTSPPPMTSFATSAWFSLSWLPEIGFAQAERWWGLPGVAWLYGLCLVALVAAMYVVCRQEGAPLGASLATVLALTGASLSVTERPQLFSYVLLVVITGAWLRAARTLVPPWWTLPIMWLWTMVHGMWLVGVLVGAGVVVGLALDRRLDRRLAMQMAAVPLAALVSSAISPFGIRNTLAFLDIRGFTRHITEFASPELLQPDFMVVLGMTVIVLVTAVRRGDQVTWVWLSIISQAMVWALYADRSVAWGALLLGPLVAGTVNRLMAPAPRAHRPHRLEVVVLGGASVVVLAVLALVVPTTAGDSPRSPQALDQELAALPEGTGIFNVYELGGWIEWQHRQLDPVIDGNTNAYVPDDVAAYSNAIRLQPGWEDYLAERGLQHALVYRDSSFARAVQERLGWEVSASDRTHVLLQAPSSG